MRRTAKSLALPLLLAIIGASCEDPMAPVPDDVQAFVLAEGLPKVRGSAARLVLPADDVLLFTVRYGEPQDCPSGCFYAGGLGLRHGGRIGWIQLDAGGLGWDAERRSYRKDHAGYSYFPLAAADTILVSARVLDQIAATDAYVTYTHFLAWHDATPEPSLYRLAERLREHGSPSLAVLLVTHPHGRCSSRLLEAVLAVPGFAYSGVHALAEEIQQQMPARCS